jgi:hypothetical protein
MRLLLSLAALTLTAAQIPCDDQFGAFCPEGTTLCRCLCFWHCYYYCCYCRYCHCYRCY